MPFDSMHQPANETPDLRRLHRAAGNTHLIHRLLPLGYGKQVLRARPKVSLADPAMAPSVLLRGMALLEEPDALGRTVETAFFKQVNSMAHATLPARQARGW